MAARRASAQFLGVLQRSSVRSFQPVAVPRQAAVATLSQGRHVNEDVARSSYGGFFANRQLHKESQAINDNEETHQYERSKMTDEGGGSVESDYDVKAAELSERGEKVAEEVKGKAGEVVSDGAEKVNQAKETVGQKTSEVADESKGQLSKNADAAKDMFKDLPQKVSETASGLKDVGVEAAKAVQRDTSKIAQRVGLKTEET